MLEFSLSTLEKKIYMYIFAESLCFLEEYYSLNIFVLPLKAEKNGQIRSRNNTINNREHCDE